MVTGRQGKEQEKQEQEKQEKILFLSWESLSIIRKHFIIINKSRNLMRANNKEKQREDCHILIIFVDYI
jgi:hypothetical protein